jgi:hypothetical protein
MRTMMEKSLKYQTLTRRTTFAPSRGGGQNLQ